MSEQANVMYLCPSAPTAKIKLGVKENAQKFQAKNGVLTLTPDRAKQLDEMMRDPRRGDLRLLFRKVDLEKAAEQVAKHKASLRPSAVAGPFTSEHLPAGVMRRERQAQDVRHLTGTDGQALSTGMKKREDKPPLQVSEIDINKVNPIEPPKAILERLKRS